MRYIQGTDRNQSTMLPTILDEYISENNSVRVIDAFVDSLDLCELGFTKTVETQTGRPSYSPYDLLKLYIYGYFNKVRSSRKLETESNRNVEVMWLLNNLKPDHKTISKFRKDNLKSIKKVFDSFVKLCLKMNIYNRQLISIDGSQFSAVNSKERNFTKGKLQDRIKRINNHIEKYLTEIETNDVNDEKIKENENICEIVSELKNRKIKYEEMLDTMEKTEELTSLADKGYISATDIANCIASEINANVCMDEESLNFCIETKEDIEKPTTQTNGRIVYLKERNICVCPMGEVLYPSSYRKDRRIARFYNTKACENCKHKCTTQRFNQGEISMKKSEFSKIYDDKDLRLKQIHYIPDKVLLKKRKSLSEHPFGIVKRSMGADYLLLKRKIGATAEMAFAFLVFNMKRVINILGVKHLIEAINLG